MKPKFQQLYMNIAHEVAKMSYAQRLKVGAVIVKDDRIISMGYNGMPAGWDNNCEVKLYCLEFDLNHEYFAGTEQAYPFEDEHGRYRLKTKSEVLHAESNAVSKLAKSTESGDGASIFVTHSPCIECAKLIYQSGIVRVFYAQDYRDNHGVQFLQASSIDVIQFQP